MPRSNNEPKQFEYLQGGILVRTNIVLKNSVDQKQSNYYEYDEIFVENGDDRGEIINKIIRNKYTAGAELALINNNNIGVGADDYKAYQNHRIDAKVLADALIKWRGY